MICMPTGRPSTVPIGTEHDGLPTMLAGMVRAPLLAAAPTSMPMTELPPPPSSC